MLLAACAQNRNVKSSNLEFVDVLCERVGADPRAARSWLLWQEDSGYPEQENDWGITMMTVMQCGNTTLTIDGEDVGRVNAFEPWRDPDDFAAEVDRMTGLSLLAGGYVPLDNIARDGLYGMLRRGQACSDAVLTSLCCAEHERIVRDMRLPWHGRQRSEHLLRRLAALVAQADAGVARRLMATAEKLRAAREFAENDTIADPSERMVRALVDYTDYQVRRSDAPYFKGPGVLDLLRWLPERRVLAKYWDCTVATRLVDGPAARWNERRPYRMLTVGELVRQAVSQIVGKPVPSATAWLNYCDNLQQQ